MSNKEKTLLLFTSSFPFGKGEQFIETEILFLAEAFGEVHIFPLDSSGEGRPLPANVKVKKLKLYAPYSRAKLLLRKGFTLLKWYRKQMRLTRHPEKYKGRFKHHFNFLMHRFADGENVSASLSSYSESKTIIYSYWFNVWTMVLLFGKEAGLHHFPVLTRAHGGDLDEQQRKSGYFPFRSLEMSIADKVMSVSEYGKGLLLKNYPEHASKISVSRLGVSDHGTNPYSEAPVFRIVSCSFVYGLKRLHLLVEILSKLDFRIEWIHFGEGELLDQLKEQASKLPANIKTDFRGLVPNKTILDYYAANPVDLFMNVSELEGIPVSIMEAISFGIPVTGCRICGVPEIVTEQTGFLFEKDFDTAEAAEQITVYANQSIEAKIKFRAGVKTFWLQHFNSEKNYPDFIGKELS